MNAFFTIRLDKSLETPLYQQLGDSIYGLIETGVLSPDSKLPPIRKMADSLNINSVTVVNAYKYLENKKAVYSHVGRGTFVSPIPLDSIPEPAINKNLMDLASLEITNPENIINFANTSIPEDLFPVSEFKDAFDELLSTEKGNAFSNLDSQGYLPLREELCNFLKHYSITTTPENILIISGAQQGIDIVSKAMLNVSDVIFMEKPSFYGAAGAFLSRGGQIIEIPMEPDGLDLHSVENLIKLYNPKFMYLMAYFQTPTGISYSGEKKRQLIRLADEYNFYIIEDDNLYDFNFTDTKLSPLKAMDYKNRVIYIKSFSKILMPGLRLGFCIMPKKIIGNIKIAKYTADISTSGFIQKALYHYLVQNTYRLHISSICNYAKKKHDIAIKAISSYLKGLVTYYPQKGGISLWLRVSDRIDIDVLCNKLLNDKGVIVSPGSQFLISESESRHIRISYVNLSDENIKEGIKKIGICIREML